MKFFSPDSKFAQVMTSVGEMMLLNICWILASLPLVTLGAANTAMYTVMLRRLRQESSGTVVPFFKAWRSNLKTGTLFWLAQFFVSGSLTMTLLLPLPVFLKVIAAIFLVLVTLVFSIVYPQLARFRNRWFPCLRNAVILLVLKFPYVLLNLLLILSPALFFLLAPVAFFRWSILWVLLGISAIFCLSAKLMVKILEPLEKMVRQ